MKRKHKRTISDKCDSLVEEKEYFKIG